VQNLFRAFASALALTITVNAAQAQSASINATASVITPLVVTGVAPLNFGIVIQGVAKTIAWNNAASGRLSIAGFGASQLALTFTLPPTLSNGATTMPINQYRIRGNGTNTTAGATRIFLTSGVPVNRNLVAGNLFVFVGGRVQPTVTQQPGVYTASVILSAAYTGL
jgi:hypothetical protein